MALAMNPIGKVWLQRHDPIAARAEFERSLALFGELGDNWGAAVPLMNLGVLEAVAGRRPAARAKLEESARLFEIVGERLMRAFVLDALASLLVADGEVAQANTARKESLDLLTKMGLAVPDCAVNPPACFSHTRIHEQALPARAERGLLSEQRLPPGQPAARLGWRYRWCGSRRAARVLTAEAVVESSAILLSDEDAAERDRTMIAIRSVLAGDTAQAEWQQGRKMAARAHS
jgi:hypothetical protein